MDKIVLFEKKENCCSCMACVNICPKNAIFMKEDECGFLYPHIDSEKCVACGKCKSVCKFQQGKPDNKPVDVYVAAKNDDSIKKSASGGIFSAAAEFIIQNDGVVFGAELNTQKDYITLNHSCITDKNELIKLKSSKYIQSSIGDAYQKAEAMLKEGKNVLFSGTPCQIGGLYGYLGRDYDNLITIDIICHGVPSLRLFNDHISFIRKKHNVKKITAYSFRDKEKSTGKGIRMEYVNKKGSEKVLYMPARTNSFYTFFLDGEISRPSCYNCKYASYYRQGDITLGDYQGISKQHPDLIKSKRYSEALGVSCVIVNTQKGQELINSIKDNINIDKSDFEKAARFNSQLKGPVKKGKNSDIIFDIYKNKGYEGVEAYFIKKYLYKILIHKMFNMLSVNLRLNLKNILKNMR